MRNVIALVLGGGRGTRLYPLTKYRSKPAVPLAGQYRLIDIPLSNCVNSGINKMYILTQFLSTSLHRHMRQAYKFDVFGGGFVEILAAQQTMESGTTDWYQGTADAVRKNIRHLQQPGIDYVVILSGDQLYRMDYREMLDTHIKTGAHATIAGIPVTQNEASALGIMRVDDTGRVQGFVEKPKTEDELVHVRMDPKWIDARGIPSRGRDLLASMGIYVFNRDFLVEVLTKTDYQDFGREIFPTSVRVRNVQLHLFDGYWEDIGTIKAFFECNLGLAGCHPPFNFAQKDHPVYTRARYLPASRILGATVKNSLISDGAVIGPGAVIENCVIGLRCQVGANVTLRNSVVMGSDDFESVAEIAANAAAGRPNIGIGEGSVIDGAIIDKNCRVGKRVRIHNEQKIVDGPDNDECVIRDGIPVVVKDATLPDGWKL